MDFLKVMSAITAAHARRKGYRADIPTDATPEEQSIAERSLDVAQCLPSIEELEGMSRAEFNARCADEWREERGE